MCGLVGFFKLNSNAKLKPEWIRGMIKSIAHRGPDDEGSYEFRFDDASILHQKDAVSNPDGVFGFRRLSIRDRSFAGHQPYVHTDGKTALLFNGEIYNADELKSEMELQGVRFCSNSDTEVLSYLYRAYGVMGMLRKINGMFAIVILDLRTNTVFLIRDRMGIKPLFYTQSNDLFLFASEPKAFHECECFYPELNEDAILETFLFRSPYRASLMKNVHSVRPGTFIAIAGGRVRESVYFSLDQYERWSEKDISTSEAEQVVEDVLCQTILRQTEADVPIGIQLSGGIDSSLITYCDSLLSNPCHKGYSILVNDIYYNEAQYVQQVANQFRIPLRTYSFDSDDAAVAFRPSTWHLDGLNTHFNSLGFYHLAQNASREVGVLLSGEGADELTGGYYQFAEGKTVSNYLNHAQLWSSEQDVEYFGTFPRDYASFAILKDMHLSLESIHRILRIDAEWNPYMRANLFHSFRGSAFDRHVKYEAAIHLEDLLLKQDRMAMAHGVENRVPFLDNEIIRLYMTIPEEYWLNTSPGGEVTGKYLLKRIASRILGENFAFRKKMEFPLPVRHYLDSEQFRARVYDCYLPEMRKQGLFHANQIYKMYTQLRTLPGDDVIALWKAFNLEEWIQMNLVR